MYKNLIKSYKDLFNQQDLDAEAVDVDTEVEPEPEPKAEPYDTELHEADEENDLTPEIIHFLKVF